jgi:hypothetical protein
MVFRAQEAKRTYWSSGNDHTCIWEGIGSSLGRGTVYSVFFGGSPEFLQVNAGIETGLYHFRFLLHPLQFIIYLSVSLSVYPSIYLWLYSPFVEPWTLFQFRNLIHSGKDSLDGGSARRKDATYTQNNTKIE